MPSLSRHLLFAALLSIAGASLAATDASGESAAASAGTLCPLPTGWTLFAAGQARAASNARALADVVGRAVVLLGEQHDDADHHLWQLQVLAGLYALRPQMVIGFEMFPRRLQPVLDRWVAGELTVKDFLAESEWAQVWNIAAELYLPLFQFARINRIPMLALNIDATLTRAIAEKGWDAVPETARAGLGRPAAASAAYRERLFEVYREHAAMRGKAESINASDPAFARFVDSQLAWDRAMAEVLARAAAPAADRVLVVGIVGSGHLRFGDGVPQQLRALGIASIATLLPQSGEADCADLRPGVADAIFAVPALPESPAAPPRLGVTLESQDGRVVISRVTAGGLAEKSGLQGGDRLVAVAGKPISEAVELLTAVSDQPPGTWLPLAIERGDQKLEVLVKFPTSQ